MLAVLQDASLTDPTLIYEPKYDGIRALIEIEPREDRVGVKIWSRLGNEKTAQFPEIVRALHRFGRKLKAPVLLDGEIVALDEAGEPAGFQLLQKRIHLTRIDEAHHKHAQPVGFIAFDALRDGREDLRPLPLTARRARLERIFGNPISPLIRLSEPIPGDGAGLHQEVLERGWEGLIAKKADSPYRAGRRSPDWRKLKIVRRQEFVIGGWTEPRETRPFFGALLLGVYEGDALQYVGHTGSGFTHAELSRLDRILRTLEIQACPFITRPKTNERPHWVEPRLVAEVKFGEWTADGRLRAPIYLGLRDDIKPETVHREAWPRLHEGSIRMSGRVSGNLAQPSEMKLPDATELLAQLTDLEERGGNGILELPGGDRLHVSNLRKKFWPSVGITKGDVLRHYVRVAPWLLPVLHDRPLVMRRFPNGVTGQAFYQQRAPAPVPPGVRVEAVPGDEVPRRIIGGSLKTLLYMAQLAVISQDPWFSRVQSPEEADYVAIDLDPMPGVGFSRVLDVARWVGEELDRLGAAGVPKTSGASGLHVYIPLQPHTSYETGRLFCQLIATVVARKHPSVATVTRTVQERGRTVYVDYLQNIRGKTLATAYSARASKFAGVSTPLTWREVQEGIDPRDFTIRTFPARLEAVGDLWAKLRQSKGVHLQAIMERVKRRRF